MTKDRPEKGQKSSAPGKPSREERLKAALKANMARRKAQSRARKSSHPLDTASDRAAGASGQASQDLE